VARAVLGPALQLAGRSDDDAQVAAAVRLLVKLVRGGVIHLHADPLITCPSAAPGGTLVAERMNDVYRVAGVYAHGWCRT
jgi:hypothetical protein